MSGFTETCLNVEILFLIQDNFPTKLLSGFAYSCLYTTKLG